MGKPKREELGYCKLPKFTARINQFRGIQVRFVEQFAGPNHRNGTMAHKGLAAEKKKRCKEKIIAAKKKVNVANKKHAANKKMNAEKKMLQTKK